MAKGNHVVDKTILTKTLIDLGNQATQAYHSLKAPELMRKVCAEIHIKQMNKAEQSIQDALVPFFEDQIKAVSKELRRLGRDQKGGPGSGNFGHSGRPGQDLGSDREGVKNQSTPIESIYNPESWNLELLQRIVEPLIETMADGIASQLTVMNANTEKATQSWNKALGDPEYQLDTPYGTVDIRILTEYPDWMKAKIREMLEETFEQDYWAQVNLTTKQDIDNFLVKGIQEGWSLRELADEIAPKLLQEGKYAQRRAELIARTESTHALNGAKSAAIDAIMADPRIVMKKVWFSALLDTTRAEHANLDGVPADKDGRWLLAGVRVRWPGDVTLPAEQRCNCYCLPGDVEVSGHFVGAQRVWYEGTLTKIVTASGTRLTVTPNHPVMTSKGWVRAGSIKPGDQVCSYFSKTDRALAGNNVENKPVSIKQVFQTFLDCGLISGIGIRRVQKSKPDDFYGDGKSLKGDVEIVTIDWKLLEDGVFASSEKIGDSVFNRLPVGLISKFGLSRTTESGVALSSTSDRLPGVREAGFDTSLFVGRVCPTGSLSVGIVSHFNSRVNKTRSNDCFSDSCSGRNIRRTFSVPVSFGNSMDFKEILSSLQSTTGCDLSLFDFSSMSNEFSSESSVVARNTLSDLDDRFASFISLDEVVDVVESSFRGHVYDLQSEYGCIIAANPTQTQQDRGIIVSNCSVVSEFGMTDSQAEQLLQDYYGRSERSTWSVPKGGTGSGNWGHAGNPPKLGGSGIGGSSPSDPVKDLNGKYIPGKVGVLAGVDTSGWKKDSINDQWAMKKIAHLEELAAKGDWTGFSKALSKPKTPYEKLPKFHKAIVDAQNNLINLKMIDVAKPAAASTPVTPTSATLSPTGWTQIGGKLGTEKGGTYLGPDGKKYYVKQPDNPDRAHNEVLACKLYEAAGGQVVKAHLLEIEGKTAVATEWIESTKINWDSDINQKKAAEDFALHAWLNNWDAVGAGSENPMDNIRYDKGEFEFKLVDAGGSLDYSGMGGSGKKKFTVVADEWDTLRNPSINPTMAKVFGGMTAQQLIKSGKKLESISDKDIKDLVEKYHGGNASEKMVMTGTLVSRKKDILKRVAELEGKTSPTSPSVSPVSLPKPAGTTVPPSLPAAPLITAKSYAGLLDKKIQAIKAAGEKGDLKALEKIKTSTGDKYYKQVHDYKQAMIGAVSGGAKTPSVAPVPKPAAKPVKIDDKKFPAVPSFMGTYAAVNETAAKALIDVAKTGDIDALKAASVASSPKLKQFHQDLISNLANQLNPPPPPKILEKTYIDAAKKIGTTKGKAGLKAIGKWAVAGEVSNVPDSIPQGLGWNSKGADADWNKGEQIWQKMKNKTHVRDYTGGSYGPMNDALRAGDFTGYHGERAVKAAASLMKNHQVLAPGTQLTRTHSQLTAKEIADLKPGTVVTDRAILSTSTKEEGVFSSNPIHWHLVAGEGVKGLYAENFTKNPGEREVLLPPNQRIMVTRIEKNVTKEYTSVYGTPDKLTNKTIVWGVILPTEDNQCCPP